MIYTTLNEIKYHSPCKSGWVDLLKYLGKTQADDVPLGFDMIVKSNGLEDALWCLKTIEDNHQVSRKFALWYARQIEYLNTDPRVKNCNDVTQRFINGDATQEELATARAAAWDARATACDAALVARAAAGATVVDAAWAALVARIAAGATVVDAILVAEATARPAQKAEFLRLINSIEG